MDDSIRAKTVIWGVGAVLLTCSALRAGEGPDDYVSRPSISDDGRFVAFLTRATNLLDYVDPESDGLTNALWIDRETRRIFNAQQIGGPSPKSYYGAANNHSLSRDGEWIVFNSSNSFIEGNDGVTNVFVSAVRLRADSIAPPTKFAMISRTPEGDPGNGNSKVPAISGNGRYVIFKSNATNLTGDTVNGTDYHHYLVDRDLDENGIFDEEGTGNTSITLLGGTTLKAAIDDGKRPSFSSDGMRALFFADSGARLYNNGVISETNAIPGGLTPEGSNTLTTSRIYPAGNASDIGTYFRYRNSLSQTFPFPDRGEGAISSNGASFILTSTESDMGGSDTNGHRDIYLINRLQSKATLISSGVGGEANNDSGRTPFEDRTFDMSADGMFIAFATEATNMGFADNNGSSSDIIIIDRNTGERDRVEKDVTPDPDVIDPGGPNPVLTTSLKKKIKKLKKKQKAAKTKGNSAKAKRFAKKIKKLNKMLRSL